jgi:hypothetical protein
MAQTPKHGDSEYNLVLKIAENFGASVNAGDSKNSILYKIANTTYQTAINPPSPSYDPDALAYVQASGATDIDNINAFIVGVKALGLYNSMVCWPLRSTQNAGTGSTAYSLGGLGTYNGTLVNGPTWGTDGVTSAGGASTPHINTSGRNRTSYTNRSVLIIVKPTGDSFDDSFFGTSNYGLSYGGSGGGLHMYRDTSSDNAGFDAGAFSVFQQINASTKIPNGNFALFAAVVDAGLAKSKTNADTFAVNTTPIAAITDTNSLKFLSNGSAEASRGLVGTMAFAMDCDTAFSQTQADSIFALYKSTLGQGLELP